MMRRLGGTQTTISLPVEERVYVPAVLTVFLSRAVVQVPRTVMLKETFRLQCLSPDQAAEVLRPIVGLSGMMTRPPSQLGLITVQTSREVMQRVQSVLDRYDSPALSQCAVQIRVPKVSTMPPVAPVAVP